MAAPVWSGGIKKGLLEVAMIAAAFAALGFLVGNLTGLSASPISKALVPSLFTLVGGSFIGFLSKLSGQDREVAAKAILALSLGCLLGTYVGIGINSNHFLGPAVVDGESYLRATDLDRADAIDQQKRSKQIDAETAYQQLRDLLTTKR